MGNVPIGSLITVNVQSQRQIDPTSIHWKGGTDITGYLGAAANSAPPSSNQIQKGVGTGGFSYSFVIDATPRTYTVAVDVEYYQVCYPDIQAPESTLTINSIAPTVNFTKTAIGTAQTASYNDPNQGPLVQVGLYTGGAVPAVTSPANAGMTITAQTNTQDFGGQFMFLQTIVPQRFAKDNMGQSFSYQMLGAGPAIDNGYGGMIGYPITNPQPDPNNPNQFLDNHSWSLGPQQSYSATMVDSPFIATNFNTTTLLQVGNFATGTPESFDTYVMYMPATGGTWVAIGKVHWAWSGKTTDAMTVTPIPNIPPPTPTVPLAGDAAFPGWTDTLTAYLARGLQPFNGNF